MRQAPGVEELLWAFDAVQVEHEFMAAEAYNDDGIYKAGLIQVRLVQAQGW